MWVLDTAYPSLCLIPNASLDLCPWTGAGRGRLPRGRVESRRLGGQQPWVPVPALPLAASGPSPLPAACPAPAPYSSMILPTAQHTYMPLLPSASSPFRFWHQRRGIRTMTSCRIINIVLNTSHAAKTSLLGPHDADRAPTCGPTCGRSSGVRSVSWRVTNLTILTRRPSLRRHVQHYAPAITSIAVGRGRLRYAMCRCRPVETSGIGDSDKSEHQKSVNLV